MRKITGITITVALLLALVVSTPVTAATEIHVPGDYATIQEAVDAANPGDSIIVHPGIYYQSVVIGNTKTILISKVSRKRYLMG